MIEVDYVGMITAMRNEFGFAKKIIKNIKSKREDGFNILMGTYNDIPVILIRSGVGNRNAERAARHIAENHSIRFLINVGFAGAIKPGVKIGDVIIGERILLAHDYNLHPENVYKGVPDLVRENLGNFVSKQKNIYKYGVILTVRRPVISTKRKKALYNTYAAECVDMEAGAIAKICSLVKIPFLSVKVISDHADFLSHPLPAVKKIPCLRKNMTFVLSKLRPLLEEIIVTPQ